MRSRKLGPHAVQEFVTRRRTKLMLELLYILAHEQVAGLGARMRRHARLLWPSPALESQCEPVSLTREDHWLRATGIITSAIIGAEHIEMLQSAAARQIDAADYTLKCVLAELAMVMPIPADGAPLRALLVQAAAPTAAKTKKALAA